jgi:hypothetical protein
MWEWFMPWMHFMHALSICKPVVGTVPWNPDQRPEMEDDAMVFLKILRCWYWPAVNIANELPSIECTDHNCKPLKKILLQCPSHGCPLQTAQEFGKISHARPKSAIFSSSIQPKCVSHGWHKNSENCHIPCTLVEIDPPISGSCVSSPHGIIHVISTHPV